MVDASPPLRLLGTRSTLADLSAINTTILKDGALVFVTSESTLFFLLKESTDAPDGVNIVQSATGSPGRWFRTDIGVTVFETQADWYVDEQNVTGLASDGNVGDTAATPLASYAELTRRIQFATLEQDTTVHLLSDVDDDSVFSFQGHSNWLMVIGEATQLLATLTSAAAANIVVGTTRPFVQLGAAWDPALMGRRCRVTSTTGATPIGTLFWLEQVDTVDPTIAYISQPVTCAVADLPNDRSLEAGGGDTFVVEELTRAGVLDIQSTLDFLGVPGDLGLTFILQDVRGPDLLFSTALLGNAEAMSRTQIIGCWMCWNIIQCSAGLFAGCRMGIQALSFNDLIGGATGCTLSSCSVTRITSSSLMRFTGTWQLNENTSFMNSRMVVGSATLGGAPPSSVTVQLGGVSMWDWTGAGIQVNPGSTVDMGQAWGTSTRANSDGVQVATGAHAQYPSGDPPDLLGTGDQVIVGGVVGTYAGLPAAGQNPGNNNAWLVARA